MSDQSNIGKGFLKDKLGDYQVNPPESVWESISGRLGGGNRRRLLVLGLATAASLALAITLGLHFFGPERGGEDRLGTTAPSGQDELGTPGGGMQEETMAQASRESAPSESGDPVQQDRSGERVSLRDRVNEAMVSIALEEEALKEGNPSELALLEQGYTPEQQTELNTEQASEQDVTPELPQEIAQEMEQEFDPDEAQAMEQENPARDTLSILTLDPGEDLPLENLPDLEQNQKKDPRWMLGAVMSPMYSFRDANGQAMEGGAEFESGLVSYAGGINVSYRGNSRLAIESGIHFSKMGIAIGAPGIQLFNRSNDLVYMQDAASSPELIAITNSIGNIITESGDVVVNGYKLNAEFGEEAISNRDVGDFVTEAEQGIEQHLDYLEVPFNLRYTVVDRTFELQVVGGLSTNFLVNNTVTMETASGETDIGYLTNIRNVNYSGNAGIGMIYHIHKRFSILLEPRFRYFLNSVNDASLPATRPYALGIYTGINYTF